MTCVIPYYAARCALAEAFSVTPRLRQMTLDAIWQLLKLRGRLFDVPEQVTITALPEKAIAYYLAA